MEAPSVLRWSVAAVLGAAAIYLSVLNWITLVRRFTRARAPSWVPLLGGLLGAGAAFVEPSGHAAKWWWAFFLLDGGSLPGLLSTAFILLFKIEIRPKPSD